MIWEGAATITREEFANAPNSFKLYREKGIPVSKKEFKKYIVEVEHRDGVFYYKWTKDE